MFHSKLRLRILTRLACDIGLDWITFVNNRWLNLYSRQKNHIDTLLHDAYAQSLL